MKLQEVRESALALPLRSRAKLATELIRSLEDVPRGGPPGSERTEAEWEAEIKRRIKAHESGEDPGIPWEEVLKEMRERENGHPNRKRR